MSDEENKMSQISRGQGRGQRLAELRKKRAESEMSSGDTASVSSVSSGSRMHSVLENLRRMRDACQSSTSSVSSGRGIAVKRDTATSIGDVASSLGELSVSEVSRPNTSEPQHRPRARSERSDAPPVVRRGESGRVVPATANYIALKLAPSGGVFEHEVLFDPPVDSSAMKLRILNENVPDKSRTFDGMTLYLPRRMPEQTTVFSTKHPVDGRQVTMTIIYKRQKALADCIHLYNVLLKRIMRALECVRIGRQNFYPNSAMVVPQHRLEVWPGYVTAVEEYEGGVMLCLDSSHRVLRTETVRDFMRGVVNKNRSRFREEITKNLIGSSVLTRYNNKLYVIDDIMWDATPTSTFESAVDGEISYVQYYEKNYGIKIVDENQPMLLNKRKCFVPNSNEKVERFVCLVPELCYMTGLTDAMRSDFRIMKDIAAHTRVTPNQRMNALRIFCESVSSNDNARAILAAWGLELADATVDLKARVLDPETIYFGHGVKHHGTPQADWGAAATRSFLIAPMDLVDWIVVHTVRDKRIAEQFVDCLSKIGKPMGIAVGRPRIVQIEDDSTATYASALNSIIAPHVQIVVIICPTIRDDRYSLIKRICCVEKPVASQVIVSRTLSDQAKLRSIVQKIALQMNCKLGGQLWSLKFPFHNWMICGIDTYHDKKVTGKSVAAFVASLNESMTRWFSQVGIQGKGIELVDSLKVCFTSALRKYYEVNGKWPSNIIVYRDGVGDGQLATCRDYEVMQMEDCLKNHIESEGARPKLTFVIVQKRINTRIFIKEGLEVANPSPGTIVDYNITRRNWYDFFIVSQHVRQGTVSPTHYVVVYDKCNIKPDHMQRLTYKMTHLYYNWPGTVRVPAPCQYAHKLAYLIGQNVHKPASDKLSDKLYFL